MAPKMTQSQSNETDQPPIDTSVLVKAALYMIAGVIFFLFSVSGKDSEARAAETQTAVALDAALNDFCLEWQQESPLRAEYTITKTPKVRGSSKDKSWVFWRLGDSQSPVAFEYPAEQVTDVWHPTRNGYLQLTRYFDFASRGVEYHSADLNRGRGLRGWDGKYQVFSDQALAQMQKINAEDIGCMSQSRYLKKKVASSVSIKWLQQVKIPLEIQYRSAGQVITHRLVNLSKVSEADSSKFKQRSDYNLIDFADIGDNESDPFLLSMMNLGFVNHGASGFYDASGNLAIGFAHRH